jgi:hypothetical protein|nr:MAG TPA: hypothetical protein [Caudoviricetes sp.]
MKDYVKLALVGLTGYFIGFYEMKYKTMKIMLKSMTEKEEASNEAKKEEES